MFFVRHNGGSVWFDELGKPWPKHKCFDDDLYGMELRQALVAEHRANALPLFGVVIEARTTAAGHGGSVVIRCSNGTLIDEETSISQDLASLVGSLTIVVRDPRGRLSLRFVEPARPLAPQPKSILEFAAKSGFPNNVLGRTVSLNNLVGRVVEVLKGGRRFRVAVPATEELKTFDTLHFVRKARRPSGGPVDD